MNFLSLRLAALAVAVGASTCFVALAAETAVIADRLELKPSVAAIAYQLRVLAPNGAVHEDLFMADEPITLPMGQFPGGGMDGVYTYEITPIRGMRNRGESKAGGGTSPATARAESGFVTVVDGALFIGSGPPELGVVRMQAGPVMSAMQARPVRSAMRAGPVMSAMQAGPVMSAGQVIPDDLIVQSSLCVGIDCVNNEVFRFDTVRLKENNLRIHFDDTSASAGFASTDWLLVANESASGGANKFSIEDLTSATVPFTVLGGAPTNSLFVGESGDIGVGTAIPVRDLHLTTADTPTFRMEQTNAWGWAAQTWDIAANEANFFVRDVTNGNRLTFRIRPGAPTSSIDVAADGDVGIGTASPNASLDVTRVGDVTMRLSDAAAGGKTWELRNNVATGRLTFSDDPARLRVPMKIAPGAVDNLLRMGVVNSHTVDINGDLRVTGAIGPDYVFEEGFDLPSIREHAEAMWSNRHLPKVGPAHTNDAGQGVINVGAQSQGMLEELEYAHIYIEQLHADLQRMRAELDAIKALLALE